MFKGQNNILRYKVTSKVNCWGDKIEEGETAVTCSRYGRYKNYIQNCKRNLRKRQCLGELKADWRIIIKGI